MFAHDSKVSLAIVTFIWKVCNAHSVCQLTESVYNGIMSFYLTIFLKFIVFFSIIQLCILS